MAWCHYIRGHMAESVTELHCSVIFSWSLASPHALSAHPVSRRNWWLCQTFSLFCGIFSPCLNKDCSFHIALGSITISVNFKQKRFYQNTDSSSPGAWYVTIHQPIYSRIRFCCLLIFRVNVVIVILRVTASSQDVFSVFMIVARLKLKQSSKPNLIYLA